jgi:hypothetical protein
MEKRMFAEKMPRDKVKRAIAVLALLPSCFLAGCAGEKGVDAGSSSSAPYSGSETATSQPENSNTENPSQNKKDDSAGKIDIEKNSMYYAKYNVREGFSAYCVEHGYEDPQIVDCSVYFCDGDDMVRLKFDFLDLAEQTQRKRVPEASDLMRKTNTLAIQYEDYVPTEITKNEDACREKKSSVGQFTKPVSFPRDENEQYLCLPQFMATIDGKKVGMKITKTTSVDEKENDGTHYPQYKIGTSEECFDLRTIRD